MKKIKIIISVFLILIIAAGGYVGNMFGVFSEGNSRKYSLNDTPPVSDSPINGKTVIFLGSSVTAGYGSLGVSFADFLEKTDGIIAVKEAVSEDNDQVVTEAMNSFKNAINDLEVELYSSNPSWKRISGMIDVDSFVTYYLVNEFAINTDSYASSCFLYKDGDNDVIHMGPTWDYDAAFGYTVDSTEIDYTLNYASKNFMSALYKFPQFAKLVNEKYATMKKRERKLLCFF